MRGTLGDPARLGQRWRESMGEAARVVAHALSGGILFREYVGERQRPVVKLVRGLWAALSFCLVWLWGLPAGVAAAALLSAGVVLGSLAALGALVFVANALLGLSPCETGVSPDQALLRQPLLLPAGLS